MVSLASHPCSAPSMQLGAGHQPILWGPGTHSPGLVRSAHKAGPGSTWQPTAGCDAVVILCWAAQSLVYQQVYLSAVTP